jgi:hypothetical protein
MVGASRTLATSVVDAAFAGDFGGSPLSRPRPRRRPALEEAKGRPTGADRAGRAEK